MTDTYEILRHSMRSGSYEAERRHYHVHKGKGERTWFVADQIDAASNIYVHDPTDEGKPASMRGFAGRTLTLITVEGEELSVRAPWHSNAEALFKDTGVDVRGTHRTFVVIANERDYSEGRTVLRDIILKDESPRLGPFDRGRWVAQGIANVMGRHVFCYDESSGGSSLGPVFPVDDGPFEYTDEERGEVHRNHNEYIGQMRKEGRWAGDKAHPKYPWK